MAAMTLAQWEALRDDYLTALTAILEGGQAKSHRGRSLQQAGLEAVQKGLARAEAMVTRLTRGGGIRQRGIVVDRE